MCTLTELLGVVAILIVLMGLMFPLWRDNETDRRERTKRILWELQPEENHPGVTGWTPLPSE